jgi:hypothetical protein
MRSSVYWSTPPDDAVATDVIEEEEAGAESGLAHFGVPHKEAAGEAARAACAAARKLDAVLFVGENTNRQSAIIGAAMFVSRK